MTITNKKTIHLQWIISFVFDALGIILLTISKQSESDPSINLASQYLGILLGLCAGLTYAVYSWSARQMIEKGIHSKSSMASMFGLAALLLLPSLLFTGENLFSNSLHTNVALYMAIIPMFLGYLCFSHGLRYIDASKEQ